MKGLLFCGLILMATAGKAQWFSSPAPLQKKDFTKIAASKITMAFESEAGIGGALTRVLEYGAQGLPVALYTIGTNADGDTINTAETFYKFNVAGRLVRETNEDKEEGNGWTNVYTYSKEGRLLKKQTVTIDPATTTYTYQAGMLISSYTTQRIPATNNKGEPTGKTVERPQEKQTFDYDKSGRLTAQYIYNLFGAKDSKEWNVKIEWKYNTTGQVSGQQLSRPGGKPYHAETYEYHANGRLKKATVQTGEEELKTFVYEYCTDCKQSWMK